MSQISDIDDVPVDNLPYREDVYTNTGYDWETSLTLPPESRKRFKAVLRSTENGKKYIEESRKFFRRVRTLLDYRENLDRVRSEHTIVLRKTLGKVKQPDGWMAAETYRDQLEKFEISLDDNID
jgi:hypothetical protein